MKILESDLTPNLKNAVLDGLDQHANNTTGVIDSIDEPSCLYIEHEGMIISGLVFQKFWGSYRLKYLWTHQEYRGEGYARQLVTKLFEKARKNNFKCIYVETLSYQAIDFYKKLGFEEEFVRTEFSNDIQFHYMKYSV